MSDFFLEYGLFLAQTVTLVAAVLVVIGFAVASSRKGQEDGGLTVKSLNERYRELTDVIRREVLPKKALKAEMKARKAEEKARSAGDDDRRRVFVIDFHGDIKASGVNPVAQLDWEDHVPPEWPAKCLLWMCSQDADGFLGEEISLRDEAIRKRIGVA